MLLARGIISIVIGLGLIIATATGGLHTNYGYFAGGLSLVFGIWRIVRGANR